MTAKIAPMTRVNGEELYPTNRDAKRWRARAYIAQLKQEQRKAKRVHTGR